MDQTTADAAVKGVVVTSGKEAFSRRRRSVDARWHEPPLCRNAQGEGQRRRKPDAVRREPQALADVRAIETSGKPWVAAINGLALGGAFELTLSCHYRVAADNPKIRLGLPEVKVGLFPGAGGTQRVPRIVPPQDAMQLLLKGEAVNAAKAKAMNLVDAVVPAADLIKIGKGLDQGRRQGAGALGREGLQAARRPGLFQGRHDDVPCRQCDLPPRNLRQLSRRPRDHAMRL